MGDEKRNAGQGGRVLGVRNGREEGKGKEYTKRGEGVGRKKGEGEERREEKSKERMNRRYERSEISDEKGWLGGEGMRRRGEEN